ncbi:MAG: hypothetical protein QOH41_768 [Blastocatellia bacterium]|jgi:hypothetical protein|nr:hypothetical protein [Blastocatellia bacterium]
MANSPTKLEGDVEQVFRDLQDKGIVALRGLYFPEMKGEMEGRYLQARIRINDKAVREVCNRFESEKGVGVSAGAQNLLDTILNAILSDPHPSWQVTPQRCVEIVGEYIDKLPGFLAAIVEGENVREEVTTFDVLHWITRGQNFDSICFIEK